MCQSGQGFNGKIDQASVEVTVIVAVMISRAIAKRMRLLRYAFSMGFRPVGIVQRTLPRFVPSPVMNEQQGGEGHNDARQAEESWKAGLGCVGLSEYALGGCRGVPSVWGAFWLNQQEVNLLAGNGAMLHSFGDYVHLAGT